MNEIKTIQKYNIWYKVSLSIVACFVFNIVILKEFRDPFARQISHCPVYLQPLPELDIWCLTKPAYLFGGIKGVFVKCLSNFAVCDDSFELFVCMTNQYYDLKFPSNHLLKNSGTSTCCHRLPEEHILKQTRSRSGFKTHN